MTEKEIEAIAHKTAAATVSAMGTKIAEGIAKVVGGMIEEKLIHKNPISPHCEAILRKPPICWDFKGIRAWVLCYAWLLMDKEKRIRLPVEEAWAAARKICSPSPEAIEAKGKELCELPHMGEICKR